MALVDHDPEGQQRALRYIVTILQASPTIKNPQADAVSKAAIQSAAETYLAAVVEMVLDGTLNHSQGEELQAMVHAVLAEMEGG